jgi:superoxide reductase
MVQLNQVYKCAVCGNIVEVTHASGGTLYCCGQPMALQSENTVDASKEKHVPVATFGPAIKVKVGAVPHPMEPNHYIEWIEVVSDGIAYKKFLHPGDKPEAEFPLKAGNATVRAYCNVHGHWKA